MLDQCQCRTDIKYQSTGYIILILRRYDKFLARYVARLIEVQSGISRYAIRVTQICCDVSAGRILFEVERCSIARSSRTKTRIERRYLI